MILRELKTGANSGVTLSLSYNELRLLNSTLYYIYKDIDHNSNFCDVDKEDIKKLDRDVFAFFELLKNGHLDGWAIDTLARKEGLLDEEED